MYIYMLPIPIRSRENLKRNSKGSTGEAKTGGKVGRARGVLSRN
jgi:hypothetical protein